MPGSAHYEFVIPFHRHQLNLFPQTILFNIIINHRVSHAETHPPAFFYFDRKRNNKTVQTSPDTKHFLLVSYS